MFALTNYSVCSFSCYINYEKEKFPAPITACTHSSYRQVKKKKIDSRSYRLQGVFIQLLHKLRKRKVSLVHFSGSMQLMYTNKNKDSCSYRLQRVFIQLLHKLRRSKVSSPITARSFSMFSRKMHKNTPAQKLNLALSCLVLAAPAGGLSQPAAAASGNTLTLSPCLVFSAAAPSGPNES